MEEYNRKRTAYELILERFYHYCPLVKEEIVHTQTDPSTHLTRYFNLNIDNRFVDVEHTSALPHININQVLQQLSDPDSINKIEKIIPLDQFSFSGFSMVTIHDTTARYALHKMRSAIIRHNPEDDAATYKTIIELLKQMCGKEELEFGLLPFLKLNDRLVSYYGNYQYSIIINICTQLNIPEHDFLAWINSYFENPQTLIKKDCRVEKNGADAVSKAFAQSGFDGYAVIPVFYSNEVVGVLEISAGKADLLNEVLFTQIDAAIPVLGQLMHHAQTGFATNITKIIRHNFTAIQPSVLWKFNEVAWNYLKNAGASSMKKMEEIRFDHLHPLYGAIDIRDSTIKRNNALHKDMHYYFKMVKNFLKELHVQDKTTVNELSDEATGFLDMAESFFTGNEEAQLDNFAERVNSYLKGNGRFGNTQ
jgi:hypothetical protein